MTDNQTKILSIPLAIALCVLVIGSIFKIQHWPYGNELKISSFVAIGVLYGVRYWFKKTKNIKDLAKVIMVLSWVLLSVFAMYKMNNLQYVRIILEVSGGTWLFLEIRDIIWNKPKSERANLPQLIGVFMTIAHVIFKILNWPFAGPMFLLSLIALILLAIGFILDSKELKKDYH